MCYDAHRDSWMRLTSQSLQSETASRLPMSLPSWALSTAVQITSALGAPSSPRAVLDRQLTAACVTLRPCTCCSPRAVLTMSLWGCAIAAPPGLHSGDSVSVEYVAWIRACAAAQL